MRAASVAGLGLLLLLPALASAQMFRWEDELGTLHYGNVPERASDRDRAELAPPASRPAPDAGIEVPPVAAALARASATTRIPYSPGQPILVSVTIAGSGPLTLILDTGADRTMIAPQALSRLGVSLANAPRAEIAGVTGTGLGDVVQVVSLEVGDAKVGPLRVIAHDARLDGADGLLGRDFLEQFTVTIDSREQVVTLVAP
ncbi:MAG: hypothetical protein C5B48_11310 [Candidatus Rokuibacteriota bacterium]|nr:MAG: hypothetical protein C5B48_11310 [Candidatus Rokubacteria bacterium]